MRFPSFTSDVGASVVIPLHSFSAFGLPSKELLFILDAFKWAPTGFSTWLIDKGRSPGMENLRENKAYAHEVAVELIEEKRQELKDGTPRKDLLSLLGLSSAPFTEVDIWCNARFFS